MRVAWREWAWLAGFVGVDALLVAVWPAGAAAFAVLALAGIVLVLVRR